MTYRVVITDQAAREIAAVADWIAADSPVAARNWTVRFDAALQSLEQLPTRCGTARENYQFPFELRQLNFGRNRSYRALFTIRADEIIVLSIRHAARRDVTPEDLRE